MSVVDYPKLNLPPIKLRAKRCDAQIRVWSEPRRCYVVLTPEEWVRRHFVEYLCSLLCIPSTRIVEEYIVPLNGQNQRADIVVLGSGGEAQLVVECKAPEVRVSQVVLDQVLRYNSILGARYVVVTNGLEHRCFDTLSGEPIGELSLIEL